MAILRGITATAVDPLLEAIQAGGLETVEITMNTEGAAALIKKSVQRFGRKMMIGAGTVLNLDSLKSAIDAGATFVVLPVLVREVVSYCVQHKIPVFPGALAPQEIYDAWCAGATMVKVFPARLFGPEYFKEVKGPFRDIELMACSGVTPANLGDYFRNGASAVAIGSSVFSHNRIANGDYAAITRHLREYTNAMVPGTKGTG
jgi:2-dehydro-3-deoxyphosphogluconate aldolase/(4S)-4-hydroxy-2-oxoglutarate aldolase